MDQHLHSAAQIIQAGGVVAYPTESVYGLGCDPFNRDAVMQLLAIKQRPVSKGLILIGENLAQLAPYLSLTEAQSAQLQTQWPAPVTYLVEANEHLPAWVRGQHRKVAAGSPVVSAGRATHHFYQCQYQWPPGGAQSLSGGPPAG